MYANLLKTINKSSIIGAFRPASINKNMMFIYKVADTLTFCDVRIFVIFAPVLDRYLT